MEMFAISDSKSGNMSQKGANAGNHLYITIESVFISAIKAPLTDLTA